MFKTLQFLSTSILVLALQIAAAGDTTVILQNGLGNYDGCQDSYVYTSYGVGVENYGGLDELKVHREI